MEAEFGQVKEGVRHASSTRGPAGHVGFEMPITETVCQVINGELDTLEGIPV